MGESERSASIPNPPLETVDKSPSLTNDGRKAMDEDVKDNAMQVDSKPSSLNSTASEVHAGTRSPAKTGVPASRSGDSSSSVPNGVHSSQKSTIENPLGTEDHSPRTTTTSTSALAMPTLASADTGLISAASNNTVDCNDTHTNESISTPPDQQSRHSKKETILYCDSQETSQSQVVVTVPQQQTVYYQIPQLPSVVTLPVESSQDAVPKTTDEIDQQEAIEQQQISLAQSHLPIETEDQIIGMVGAIPIIKIQGGGTHYVKEKKGRFNLLQTTPVIPSVVGVTSSTSSTSQTQAEEARNSTVAPVSNSSNSRSQSPAPVVACTTAAPQTFDGKSAPTVKRKGRFVVTNVKDPGSIIQIQTKSAPEVAVAASSENTVTSSQQEQIQPQQPQHQQQEPQIQAQPQPIQQQQTQVQVQVQQPIQQPVQQQQQPSNQQQQTSPLQTPMQNPPIPIVEQTYQQPNVSQIPLQPVVIQPVSTIQQYEIPQQYQQIHTQHTVPATQQVSVQHYPQNLQPQTVQYASVNPQNQQQNYVQYVPQVQHTVYASNQPTYSTGQPISVAVPHGQQVVYNQQYPQHIPQQHYSPRTSYVQTQQIHPSPSFPVNQQPVSQTRHTATPPTTPGGSTSSPVQTRPVVTSTLPNAPIPKPTTTNLEKQSSTKSVTKKKTTGRTGKVPQSFDSNGTGSSIGFGRVFYLLDQMKTEVTDADQSIKTLQTDMKLLRKKNKDLEAKNNELDSKLREEQALREKTEIRNMDLRKKLREAKDEIKALKLAQVKTTKDENESPRHTSTDAVSEKVSNPNSGGKEAKTTITGSVSQPMKTVSGASPKRNTAATDGTLKTGSSHSHSNISQLATTSPISKVNGMNGNLSLNIPKIDLNLKEQPELKNATKPRVVSKESELRRAKSMELSTATKSAKEKTDVSHHRVESMHTLGTPPLVPPLRSQINGTKASGHKHTQSLHEFDPLKSTVPVLSFQAPLSFETLPIKTTATSESVPLPQYMSQSGVMMPVSFGVSPTAVRTTDGGFRRSPPPMTAERQTLVANNYQGLHEQQFMVVPQQQPIVFNQMAYPTQQRSSAVQNHQYTNGSVQQQNGQHQPLRGHVQQPTHQQAAQQTTTYTTTASAHPFHSLT